MNKNEYVSRQEMLSELRSGFFPQDVVYTEAVSIAEQIVRAVSAADVAPKGEVAREIYEKLAEKATLNYYCGYITVALEEVMAVTREYIEKTDGGNK